MDSSLFFKTENDFSYCYDMKNLSLLNIHPVMETIKLQDEFGKVDNNETYFLSLFPHLSQEDIRYYIRKYKFLKDCGYFSFLDIPQYRPPVPEPDLWETVPLSLKKPLICS